jgi:hypothetical protein
MAQLGGLVMLDPANQEAKEQFFFGGIEGCRFRRPVVPGDTLVRIGDTLAAACNEGNDEAMIREHTIDKPAVVCCPVCAINKLEYLLGYTVLACMIVWRHCCHGWSHQSGMQ